MSRGVKVLHRVARPVGRLAERIVQRKRQPLHPGAEAIQEAEIPAERRPKALNLLRREIG